MVRQRDDHRLTCDDWLAFIRPRLAEALVGDLAFARLREMARRLPGDGLAALEIRLAPALDAVDLSWKAPRRPAVPTTFCSPRIRQLLRRWSTGGLPSVASVWLELDADRFATGPSDPVLCVEVARGADPALILEVLFGTSLDPPQRALALRSATEIRPPARLLYVFDLGPRGGPRTVRLEILGLAPEQAADVLKRHAPHLVPAVSRVAPLLAGAERPHLSFDVGPDGIGPRAGLEGSFVKWPHREPRWRELFDRLVEHGLCAPEKRDAIFAWPGQETFWTAADRWPAEAAGTRGVCVRALSHVKIVAEPGRAPEAKAYLLFGRIGPAERGV